MMGMFCAELYINYLHINMVLHFQYVQAIEKYYLFIYMLINWLRSVTELSMIKFFLEMHTEKDLSLLPSISSAL